MAGVDASLSSAREPDAIPITPPETEAIWRGILLGTDKRYRESYTFLSRQPGSPRCRMCAAPFKGPGAVIARRMGRRPWAKKEM